MTNSFIPAATKEENLSFFNNACKWYLEALAADIQTLESGNVVAGDEVVRFYWPVCEHIACLRDSIDRGRVDEMAALLAMRTLVDVRDVISSRMSG